MAPIYSDHQLQAFLDEGLAAAQMTDIELQLRSDAALWKRLQELVGHREAGVHTIAEIWRRHRLSCPTRQQLGNFLLGALEDEWMDYVRFHVERVACRLCVANLDDLRHQQAQMHASNADQLVRRRKYFQSSAGYLKSEPNG